MKIHIDGQTLSKRLPAGNGGIYRATITGRKIATSKSSGNPKMQLEFTLNSEGPNPAVKTIGKAVYDNLTFTEDSLWRANLLFNVVSGGQDIPAADYTPDEFFNMLWNACQNKQLVIEITDEVYEGTARPKVSRYQAAM